MMIRIAAGLLVAVATAGLAHAEELSPMQAKSITLGSVTGVAYYTVAQDGFEVVTTLAAGEGGQPMRFVTTLAAGQRIVLSAPQAAGREALDLEISRTGNRVLVSDAAMVMN